MILIIASYVLTAATFASPTLKDAFESARRNMESLKRADAVIQQSVERKNRIRSAVLPNINGVGTYTKIDPPDAAGASPFLLTRQYSAAIRLQQPILRGGLFAANQQAREQILLAEFQKNATEISLYQLVINSYYNLYMSQVDVTNLEELRKFSKDRVRELSERTKVGRSRKGELVQAETQLLNAEAQYQQGLINLESAARTYEFYTKTKAETIPVLEDLPKKIGTLQDFLSKMKTRPDILARKQEIVVASKQVEISKGSHYPSVDFTGNYYLTRTGVLETSDWDAGVAVVIPLFQGGGVQAAVREAVELRRVSELNSFETERAAERDISVLFQNYLQIHDQLETLKNALAKSEQSYKLTKADYQYGQVTNLEVLQALNLFIEAKRSYNNVSSLAHMTYRNLEAAVGVLP